MSKFTFLKSDRSNIQTVLITGVFFITISILDVFGNIVFQILDMAPSMLCHA